MLNRNLPPLQAPTLTPGGIPVHPDQRPARCRHPRVRPGIAKRTKEAEQRPGGQGRRGLQTPQSRGVPGVPGGASGYRGDSPLLGIDQPGLCAQLSCLARLLAAKNLTADFGSFPPDLLLFFQ